jgi:hypothetical protein
MVPGSSSSNRLGTWCKTFKKRLQQIAGWALGTLPRQCFWLGGLAFPKCWFACVRQDLARREGVPLDGVMLVVDVNASLATAAANAASTSQAELLQQQHFNGTTNNINNNSAASSALNDQQQQQQTATAASGSGLVNQYLDMGLYRVQGLTLEGAVAQSATDFTQLATLTPPPGRQFRSTLPTLWIGAARVSGLGENPEVDAVVSMYHRRRGGGSANNTNSNSGVAGTSSIGGGAAAAVVNSNRSGNNNTSVTRTTSTYQSSRIASDVDAISNAVSAKSVFWCPMYHSSKRGSTGLLLEVPFRSNPNDSANSNEAWSLASVAVVCAVEDE